MAYAKSSISVGCGCWSVSRTRGLLVLVLLPSNRVLHRLLLSLLVAQLIVGTSWSIAGATERTFVLSPAEVVSAPDLFGAEALTRSAVLGKVVGLKRGAVRFGRGVCPSLLADPTRKLTRLRVLGGPETAPLVFGKSVQKDLAAALTAMHAVSWVPPGAGTTRQSSWVVDASAPGVVGFATAGFAIGDQTGALGKPDASNRNPGFRVTLDIGVDPGTGPSVIAVALTTELAPKKPGKPGKRTECILVMALLPADITALRNLVDAAGLGNVTRNRLMAILDTAATFVSRGRPDRAARNVRTFALEVAQRSETEIPPASAEALITRANLTAEALGF